MYKLSPSDFAYLYEECKCCYYLKVRNHLERPKMLMPGVFSAINTRLQGALIGKQLTDINSKLPEGIVESQEGFVESAIFPGTKVYIKGKYDLLVKQNDGTYMIIDLKLSTPDQEKVSKYQSQLWSYVYAFEHPSHGEPKTITKAGLLIFYPDTVSLTKNEALLTFPPSWFEVPIDREKFESFMSEVSFLLEGPTLNENKDCSFCQYRHLGEKLAHPQTEDIPF